MSENPYRSPESTAESIQPDRVLRGTALRCFRFATLVLLIPAVYNYVCFDLKVIASGGFPGDIAMAYRIVNLACFAIGVALIWFLGVPLLERLSGLVRRLFAKDVASDEWQRVLLRTLRLTAVFAVPAALLWAIWVFGFYQRGWNFYAVSWAVGVPAHLLAACLYVPLVVRWYRLAATNRASVAE